jgi:acetylornithine/N-succinyldiaminopimelate aminotransferase
MAAPLARWRLPITPKLLLHLIVFVPLNDRAAVEQQLNEEFAAVIVEGIQGVGGIQLPEDDFLVFLQQQCTRKGCLLILDEIQSGYGRTGKFFAHQYAGIKPHLITTAKGMGNGFPIGGVLIHGDIKPWSGMLGTTFGGNYLASVAGLAVLEVMQQENLIANAKAVGDYLVSSLQTIGSLQAVRGRGLMIGFDLPEEKKSVRSDLLLKHRIFTGEAKPNTIRLLPSLTLTQQEAGLFLTALKEEV